MFPAIADQARKLGLSVALSYTLSDNVVHVEISGGQSDVVVPTLYFLAFEADKVDTRIYANIVADWHGNLVTYDFVTAMRSDELADGHHWFRPSVTDREIYDFTPRPVRRAA